jgi:hypothetical protein
MRNGRARAVKRVGVSKMRVWWFNKGRAWSTRWTGPPDNYLAVREWKWFLPCCLNCLDALVLRFKNKAEKYGVYRVGT